MNSPRIDARRLVKVLFISTVLPISGLLLIDLVAGTLPILTILAVVIFMPAGAFFVNRAALAEFDKVVAAVAPPIAGENAHGADVTSFPFPDGAAGEASAPSAVDEGRLSHRSEIIQTTIQNERSRSRVR